MTTIVRGNALAFAAELANKCIGTGGYTPQCRAVEIRGGVEELSLHATDLTTEISVAIGADVGSIASTTIDAATLHKLAKASVKAGSVALDVDNNAGLSALPKLTIQGRTKYTVASALPLDDMPEWLSDLGHDMDTAQIAAPDLLRTLTAVLSAASTDEVRPSLNCVAFDTDKERLCATDGHRLHVVPLRNLGAGGISGVHLMPQNTAQLLLWLLKKYKAVNALSVIVVDGKIGVRLSGTVGANGSAFCADVLIYSRRDDGNAKFPPVDKVTPHALTIWSNEIVCETAAIVQGVKDVLLIDPDGYRVRLGTSGETGRLELHAENIDDRTEVDANVHVVDRTAQDPDMRIGADARYIAAAFQAVAPKDGAAWMRWTGPVDAIVIGDLDGAYAVVMPIRL